MSQHFKHASQHYIVDDPLTARKLHLSQAFTGKVKSIDHADGTTKKLAIPG